VGADGEIREAQHRVDGGEADGRHRENSAGDQTIDEELQGFVEQG